LAHSLNGRNQYERTSRYDFNGIEERMEKAVESLEKRILPIRTGRANPALLDRISINYYVADSL
jgi:ribosome recycling factor